MEVGGIKKIFLGLCVFMTFAVCDWAGASVSDTLLGQLEVMRRGASRMEGEIKKSEAELEGLKKSTEDLRGEISALSSRVDELLVILRSRLKGMYKYSFLEQANALFALSSAQEAVELGYAMERIARQDMFNVNELHAKITALETKKLELSRREERISALIDAVKDFKAHYKAAEESILNALESIRLDKQKAAEAVRELNEMGGFIGQTILARLDRQMALAGQKKGNLIMPGNSAKGDVTFVRIPVAPTSRLEWPITGPLASRFGLATHPALGSRFQNTGIDIKAVAHAPVKAAWNGSVFFVGWLAGFGQAVILDHGRSFFTVYACLSAARVKEGDSVRVGDVIGTVGNTGTMTGYALHFEIRMGKEAKDPLQYLKKL